MNSTILFFSDFGHAIHAHGDLTAIIEKPSFTGERSTFQLRYTNTKGHSACIETSSDFYIYEGIHLLIKTREWTSFSSLDLDTLALQLPEDALSFSRLGYVYTNNIPGQFGLTHLKPASKPIPKEKRFVGNLIAAKLLQAS